MKITKQELEQIYWNNSNKKACEILKITNATLTKYLRQNILIIELCQYKTKNFLSLRHSQVS